MKTQYLWTAASDGYEAHASKINFPCEIVHLPAGGGTVSRKLFKPNLGSGYDVLYWTFTRVGPGRHETTYTIWNR